MYISQCLSMAAVILLTLSLDQNRNIHIYMIWFSFLNLKIVKLITLYTRNAYKPCTYINLHYNGCYLNFCNSEIMTSFPHNFVLDSQPRFGLTPSEV